jgi:hypothetical protein
MKIPIWIKRTNRYYQLYFTKGHLDIDWVDECLGIKEFERAYNFKLRLGEAPVEAVITIKLVQK